jgi:hypothetical protein
MRFLLHSPKDMVAGALAFAAVSAIVANALFLQAGRHPSPMFGPAVAPPATGSVSASPLPRPRPVEADLAPSESKSSESKPAEMKTIDPMTNLVRATSIPPAAATARPPAPIPAPSRTDAIASSGSRRVASVQRALTEYGYGQLKATGTVGSDTQAAISKFEREHKLPITGQVSDRLVRELSAMIGHPVD